MTKGGCGMVGVVACRTGSSFCSLRPRGSSAPSCRRTAHSTWTGRSDGRMRGRMHTPGRRSRSDVRPAHRTLGRSILPAKTRRYEPEPSLGPSLNFSLIIRKCKISFIKKNISIMTRERKQKLYRYIQ